MPDIEQQWFYRRAGREVGPLSWARLRELASAGEVALADDVRVAPSTEWRAAGTVTGLIGAGGDNAAVTSTESLPPGTEVGRQLKVERWEPDRLRLKGDVGDNVFLLIGLACLAVGLVSAAILIARGRFGMVFTETFNDSTWVVQFARYMTLLGLAIPLIVLRSTSGGFNYTIDGASRTVRRDNFLRFLDRTWPADRFEAVTLAFAPQAQFDAFSLDLAARAGGKSVRLTYTNADRPEGVPMAVVAGRVAELLSLPVRVDGQARTASAPLREAIARLG